MRYIGNNPKNYLTYNNETAGWRIVGVFNNMTTSGGANQTLVKIVKDSSIGSNIWHSSNSSDYKTSDMQKTLNLTYLASMETNSVNRIQDVVWKYGGSAKWSNIATPEWYTEERSTKAYSGHSYTWTGKVAVIYVSDYGYATSGGNSSTRNQCLGYYTWSWSNYPDCSSNSFLLFSTSQCQWTLSNLSGFNQDIMKIYGNGNVQDSPPDAKESCLTHPALYLKADTIYSGGTGTKNDPIIINY